MIKFTAGLSVQVSGDQEGRCCRDASPDQRKGDEFR